MLRIPIVCSCLAFLVVASASAQPGAARSDNVTWRFRVQEVDPTIKVGYSVVLADINGDKLPDLVVADTNEVLWYENPSWRRHIVIRNQTKEDNVCLAPLDIDGDGHIDLALGAGWPQGFRTKDNATIQWLKRGPSLDVPWTVHPIGEEPMVHRMGFVDLDGDGRPHLIVVPLIGRDGSKVGNWTDGRHVRILDYAIPADPIKGPWTPRILCESLHVVHGFTSIPAVRRKGFDLLTASYEGVSRLTPLGTTTDKWGAKLIASGNQDNATGPRGASEVGVGKLKSGKQFLATIEPWHGNQFVVYTPPDQPEKLWDRSLVDSRLRWGHAIACVDLDGDGNDEVIVGVRDDPRPADSHSDRRGVRIYRYSDEGRRWERHLMSDAGAVAVESMCVGDLNGDGRPDIVAAARQTGNLRIYWNEKSSQP